MTKTTTQTFKVPAVTEVTHGKSMADCVGTGTYSFNPYLFEKCFKVSFHISYRHLPARTSLKKIILYAMSHIPKEPCAEFFADGYETVFTTLANDEYGKFFQIHVFMAKGKCLGNTQPAVKNRKCNKMSAFQIDPFPLPADEPPDVAIRERG